MGVDQLCVIVVQKRSAKDYRLRAKIFDVETGWLKQTASYPNYMKNDFDLYDLSNSAALEFASMCIISRMNILADSYQTELDADIEKLKSVRKNVNLKALTLSLVPGLGLMQKGHKGEG